MRSQQFVVRILVSALLLTTWTTRAWGQEIRVTSGFADDSIKVGQNVSFYLTARYPKGYQLVFPDSTFSFAPFELTRKDYFPTETKDSLSYDSAVYSLRTFELDLAQALRLPVFVINPTDCTRVYSGRDTIQLKLIVAELPDSTFLHMPLKATTNYYPVSQEVNGPLILAVASLAIVLLAMGWVVLGPALRQRYRIRSMVKSHEAFTARYEAHLQKIAVAFSATEAEAAVTTWKKYMEATSRRPYTKLTTRETELLEKDGTLGKNLRLIDGAVYGYDTNVMEPLKQLKAYADNRFKVVMDELKNEH